MLICTFGGVLWEGSKDGEAWEEPRVRKTKSAFLKFGRLDFERKSGTLIPSGMLYMMIKRKVKFLILT